MNIRDNKNNHSKTRTLLDTCATVNLIPEAGVKRLGLHVITHALSIGAINATCTESRGWVKIVIESIVNDFFKELTCLMIPTIAELIPSETFPRDSIKIPSNIRYTFEYTTSRSGISSTSTN